MSWLKTLNVVYDGHCGFCIRALNVVRALDVRHALRFYDAHQPETLERFPILREADLDEALYVVAEGEPPYRGFFAFRRMLWISPLMWLLIPLFYFPGAGLCGPRVYAWVARNRSRFGCGSEVCALPTSSRASGK